MRYYDLLKEFDNFLYENYDSSIEEYSFEQLHELMLAYKHGLYAAIECMAFPEILPEEMRKIRKEILMDEIREKYYHNQKGVDI